MTAIVAGLPKSSAANTDAAAHAHALVVALGSQCYERARPSPRYRCALVLVAFVMLLLPLVYVGLIATICYGLWQFARAGEAPTPLRGGTLLDYWSFYWLVLVSGSLFTLSLLKPVFAPRAGRDASVALERSDEPVLHAFVERLAGLLRAPPPRRIEVDCQVNAAAGYSFSPTAFRRGDSALVVGLPLVAGLSASQFAGATRCTCASCPT